MSANWLGELHSTKTDVHFYVTVVIIVFCFCCCCCCCCFFQLLSCVYLFYFIVIKLLLLLLFWQTIKWINLPSLIMLKKVAPRLAASYKFQREGDQCTTVSMVFAGICEDFTLGRGYNICMILQCFYSAGATNLRLDYWDMHLHE